ncbi:MAG: hypothetical protein DMD86_14690 [Candidatus Rokuibacteriota bacterium]|nr:MAG: hypothetical protein DMD86_14690 [Candidatus Rokubacteria bacterium]
MPRSRKWISTAWSLPRASAPAAGSPRPGSRPAGSTPISFTRPPSATAPRGRRWMRSTSAW